MSHDVSWSSGRLLPNSPWPALILRPSMGKVNTTGGGTIHRCEPTHQVGSTLVASANSRGSNELCSLSHA